MYIASNKNYTNQVILQSIFTEDVLTSLSMYVLAKSCATDMEKSVIPVLLSSEAVITVCNYIMFCHSSLEEQYSGYVKN